MKRFILLLIVFAFLMSCNNKKGENRSTLRSPLAENGFSALTSHQEMSEYLFLADSLSELITVEIAGKSVENRNIFLVKAGEEGAFQKDKPTVYLFAQQHGDEPSGKEGLLLLIHDIVQEKNTEYLQKVNLLMIPQVNPDGGEKNRRRNAQGIDLNRDHLVLEAPETQTVHQIFNQYKPEVTVDIHEYSAYSDYWMNFGYRKDFDIQLGGLTNLNVDEKIKQLFYDEVKPYVKEKVTQAGYSFFEYTLGDFPGGGRMRHSTVDVNDGRQSFGILNSLSFIVEGKYGRDSVHNLKNRAMSQYITAKSLVKYVAGKANGVKKLIKSSRAKLKNCEKGEEIAIRMEHVKGDETLEYPLKSVKTGEDTIFVVDEFHSRVISLLDIQTPKGYLVPSSDEKLVKWLDRSYVHYTEYQRKEEDTILAYRIKDLTRRVDEGLENYYPKVELKPFYHETTGGEYLLVPVSQLRSTKIVTAVEPQSMLGLVNYTEFEYLIRGKEFYPILRVE